MSHFKCQHCGARNEYTVIVHKPKKQKGLLASTFNWSFPTFYHPPKSQRVELYTETKNGNSIQRNVGMLPVTIDDLKDLGRVYVGLRMQWSRTNTTELTNLSQTQHNEITKAFLERGILWKVNKRKYSLTYRGERLLRHFNDTR